MSSNKRPHLISLTHSPWSEKARWALEHHRVVYRRTPYLPVVGEPFLRLRTGKLRGRMTVPVLHHGDGWLTESWEIARWAERVGSGTSLFPESKLSTIEHFEALSERGLASGRALATTRMLAQPRLAASMAPPAVRASLGPLAAALASVAMRRTLRKYGAGSLSLTGHKSELRRVLDALREALAQRSGDGDAVPTLLGTFSYADIVAAQVLQFVTPRNLGRFELGPEGQEGYRDAELSSEYADLDDWRVRLYAAYDPSHQEVLGAGPYVRTFRGVR